MDEQENLVNIMVQDTELDLPILVVRSFEVDVCVRGLHFFKNFPAVGTTLSVSPEDDPMSLVHDRYAIAVKMADSRKIGHVPKFMSRFVFFFLRHGGTVELEVAGPREYSWDLEQGGLQIPAIYRFSSTDEKTLAICQTNIIRLVTENVLA